MSDPVSSMDVEDVLSSIRRLVSEEAKSGSAENITNTHSTENIYEAAENAADQALDEVLRTAPQGFDADAEGAPPSNDYTPGVAPVAAPVTDEPVIDEVDDPRMSFRHQAAAAARRGEEQKLVLTAALRVASPETDAVTPDQGGAAPKDETALNDVVAEQHAERPQRPHLRPVGDGEEAPLQTEAPVTPKTRAFDCAPEDTLFDRAKRAMEAVKPEGAAVTAFETPARDSHTTVDKIDLRMGASHPPQDAAAEPRVESDAPSADAMASDARNPTSPFSLGDGAINLPPQAAPEPGHQLEDEPSTINFAEEEESILDEETLRDMVSEMVREELQGELGDRITRNVRKLVRREIQRAIASREFE